MRSNNRGGQVPNDYARQAEYVAISAERNRSIRNLEYAYVRINIYKAVFVAGYVVLFFNGFFTYTSARSFLNNNDIAIGLTIIITAVQIVVNGALFSGGLKSFQLLTMDFNGDGKISPLERLLGGIFISAIVGCYLLDIGTNLLGVDVRGGQEMGVGIGVALLNILEGVGVWDWLLSIIRFALMLIGNAVPLFCAALLCVGDELCTLLSEREIHRIQQTIPDLKQSRYILNKRLESADAFGRGLAEQSVDQAHKRGLNYRV